MENTILFLHFYTFFFLIFLYDSINFSIVPLILYFLGLPLRLELSGGLRPMSEGPQFVKSEILHYESIIPVVLSILNAFEPMH
jgi:hypothetical protein